MAVLPMETGVQVPNPCLQGMISFAEPSEDWMGRPVQENCVL